MCLEMYVLKVKQHKKFNAALQELFYHDTVDHTHKPLKVGSCRLTMFTNNSITRLNQQTDQQMDRQTDRQTDK